MQDFVVSRDGTRIGFQRLGAGPALVIVHGGINAASDWMPTAEILARRFSCFVMDRRGRGASSDGADYALACEAEDISAVLDAAGPDATLVGHSFGGVCSLEMALTRPVTRLIVYEPPLGVRDNLSVIDFVAGVQALLAQGRPADAVTHYLTDRVGMPEDALARYRGSPGWERMLAMAHTIPREAGALGKLGDPVRYRAIQAPTLALAGELSSAEERAATTILQTAMPQIETRLLPGHGHTAHRTAPDLLARCIADFIG